MAQDVCDGLFSEQDSPQCVVGGQDPTISGVSSNNMNITDVRRRSDRSEAHEKIESEKQIKRAIVTWEITPPLPNLQAPIMCQTGLFREASESSHLYVMGVLQNVATK